MIGDHIRAETARYILDDRQDRYAIFPSEIFDEFAWNMLLHLFVSLANNELMTEKYLIVLSGASIKAGQHWLAHLAQDGQVETRIAGDDVILTSAAIANLRRYLDHVADRPALSVSRT